MMLEVIMTMLSSTDSARIPCVYRKGMFVSMENDVCTSLGIVLSGRLKMTHYGPDGSETVHAIIDRHALFGDFLLFASQPHYPGHLIALEDATVLHVPKARIEVWLVESSDFRQQFLQHLSHKALEFNDRQKLLAHHTLEARIIYWLMREQTRLSTKTIPHHGQETLAAILRVQRPSLTRALKRLQRRGILSYNRQNITLH